MITNIKSLEKYCKDYTKIENYEEALSSPLKYDVHHRLEISENKSASDLIAENLYYDRPQEELIFLSHVDHMSLHKAGDKNPMFGRTGENSPSFGKPSPNRGKHLSAETKQKLSDANKGKCRPAFSTEWKQKMSDAKKGKPKSLETRQKMSVACRGEKNSMFGRHWHLENGKRIYTD